RGKIPPDIRNGGTADRDNAGHLLGGNAPTARELVADERQLTTALTVNGSVLLGTPEQIGHYSADRTVGHVLGHVVAHTCQVERDVVAHAVKLGKPDALIVGAHAVFRHQHGEVVVAVLVVRSEEHTSELQSRENLVCRLLLEK